jgi:hypothetical protein
MVTLSCTMWYTPFMDNAPKILPHLTPNDITRFWSKVRNGPPRECWPWLGGTFQNGYGRFAASRRSLKSHRVAFYLSHGYDPGDAYVCHHCDNPSCCNGSHLFDGTAAANSADMAQKGRTNTPSGVRHGSVTKPESRARGEGHGNAKLTAQDVLNIRTQWGSGGFTMQSLADRFGISRRQIGFIVRREQWAHI